MPAGSLRSAISKQADWLNSSMAKVKMLVDTARVSFCSETLGVQSIADI
jgi:hypothetical protein